MYSKIKFPYGHVIYSDIKVNRLLQNWSVMCNNNYNQMCESGSTSRAVGDFAKFHCSPIRKTLLSC